MRYSLKYNTYYISNNNIKPCNNKVFWCHALGLKRRQYFLVYFNILLPIFFPVSEYPLSLFFTLDLLGKLTLGKVNSCYLRDHIPFPMMRPVLMFGTVKVNSCRPPGGPMFQFPCPRPRPLPPPCPGGPPA